METAESPTRYTRGHVQEFPVNSREIKFVPNTRLFPMTQPLVDWRSDLSSMGGPREAISRPVSIVTMSLLLSLRVE